MAIRTLSGGKVYKMLMDYFIIYIQHVYFKQSSILKGYGPSFPFDINVQLNVYSHPTDSCSTRPLIISSIRGTSSIRVALLWNFDILLKGTSSSFLYIAIFFSEIFHININLSRQQNTCNRQIPPIIFVASGDCSISFALILKCSLIVVPTYKKQLCLFLYMTGRSHLTPFRLM